MIFFDCEGLEGFSETDTVGNNATAKAFELVDRSDDAIALKFEQLFPDGSIADSGRGFYDSLFVQFIAKVFEYMEERKVVNQRRRFVI